jgi:hypothetical protein
LNLTKGWNHKNGLKQRTGKNAEEASKNENYAREKYRKLDIERLLKTRELA